MSNRDKRNWIIVICTSLIFTCGYVYGRAAVLQEYNYEITKASYILNEAYDNLCSSTANLNIKK